MFYFFQKGPDYLRCELRGRDDGTYELAIQEPDMAERIERFHSSLKSSSPRRGGDSRRAASPKANRPAGEARAPQASRPRPSPGPGDKRRNSSPTRRGPKK